MVEGVAEGHGETLRTERGRELADAAAEAEHALVVRGGTAGDGGGSGLGGSVKRFEIEPVSCRLVGVIRYSTRGARRRRRQELQDLLTRKLHARLCPRQQARWACP